MLVLSRRPGQKVLFPSLGISIEVLRSRGSIARLGIEAPDDIPVLREEVLGKSAHFDTDPVETSTLTPIDRELRHAWKNKLNQLMLKLELLQGQLDAGQAFDPERRLNEVFSELTHLEQATADDQIRHSAPTVLIVEDQANERELLASCLRQRGLQVETASNGREAFDLLHERELPDLVLLDMRMPEVDGPTLLKSVREDLRLRNLRIFAVSGSSPDEFDSAQLPLDGWISKPVRIDALLRAVHVVDSPSVITA